MSVEENKAVVRRWNEEIVSGGKPELFDEVLDRDYTNRSGSDGPWSPDTQGLDQAKEHFGQGLREYPNYRVLVDDMIGEGDKVAARLTWIVEGKKGAQAKRSGEDPVKRQGVTNRSDTSTQHLPV